MLAMYGTTAREQRVKDQARELDRRIKALRGRRDPTGNEEAEVAAIGREAQQVYDEAAAIKAEKRTLDAIRELGEGLGLDDEFGPGYGGHSGGFGGASGGTKHLPPKVRALGGSRWGAELIGKQQQAGGSKALLSPAGTVAVTVPVRPEVITEGQPVAALRQLVPTVANTSGHFAFMRQVTRTNNAAPVAPGARKPTSVFTASRVDDRTRVIAHLSEAINRQDISDAPMLEEFVDAELRLGLETALEEQMISGDGAGENFTGLSTVSGAQTYVAPAGEDVLTSTRKAVTLLEVLSLSPSGWVLHPNDWQRIELLLDNEGAYYMGGQLPVQRASRRLWGVPVAVSTAATAGVGFLVDFAGSTELHLREDAVIDWSENLYNPDKFGAGVGGSLFEANEIVFRCEGRFGLAVKRPAGIVKVTFAA